LLRNAFETAFLYTVLNRLSKYSLAKATVFQFINTHLIYLYAGQELKAFSWSIHPQYS